MNSINKNKNFGGKKIFIKIFSIFFKLILSITSIIFIAILSFIIILSTKPRVIPIVNNYILNKVNEIQNTNLSFDPDEATLYFESPTSLIYTIDNLDLKIRDTQLKFSKFILNLDFIDIFFKHITINNIIIKGSSLNITIDNKNNKESSFDYKVLIKSTEDLISKALQNQIIIRNFALKNFKITFLLDNKNIDLNLENLSFNINIQDNNLIVNQDTLFNLNNSKVDSKLQTTCKNQENNKICNINISNINLDDYTVFFEKTSSIYDYLYNINGLFDLDLNFTLNKNLEFENGSATITSKLGSFYLKQFFDEKIVFMNLIANASFEDNFKKINLNPVKTSFGKTDFNMSISFSDDEEYRDIAYDFKVKDVPINQLKKFWPNFLGEEDVRPWVIEHITSGTSPNAWAKINMRYYKDEKRKKESGLQSVYSEVQMDKVLLNYSDYFPIISNINGLAIFTQDNMNIKINSGNVLNTKIIDGNIFMDFTKKIKDISIKANTKGPIADLFVHIDKGEKKIIEAKVADIVEDYYTNTKLNINVPIIDNIDFKKVAIIVDANILNKTNSILKNSSNIIASFTKPKNSDGFFGKINLIDSNIEFFPLNIYKPAKKELAFDYEAIFKDSVVYILKFDPTVNYIKFNIDGVIDLAKKEQELNIENIRYNKSQYNVYYKSYVLNNKLYNDINITGNNINYENIIDKMKNNTSLSSSGNETINDVETEDNINLNLKYFSFANDQKLNDPILSIKIIDKKMNYLNFSSNMKGKNFVKLNFDKKKKMFNLKSNDFGQLFNTVGLTDKIENGSGEININQKRINGKDVIVGDLKIDKKFSIVPDEEVKKDVLSDVKEDKNFKNLEKGLKKEKGITFDKLKGEFTYDNDILTLKEIVANSRFIKFQILLSGFINIKTGEMDMKGLFVPLGFINGLFGINKLPVIGELIFGQKDAGLFASKFTITKKNNDSKMNIDIDKFSMILPGFLRNIFSKSTWTSK